MVWFVLALTFSTLLDLVGIGRLSNHKKDLEILILGHRPENLEQKQTQLFKTSRNEQLQ